MSTLTFIRARAVLVFEALSVALPSECPGCSTPVDEDAELHRSYLATGSTQCEVAGGEVTFRDDGDMPGHEYPTGLRLGCCGHVLVPASVTLLNQDNPPAVVL